MMQIAFKSRLDYTTPIAVPIGEYVVESFSWNAIGGPDMATIHVQGDPLRLAHWLDLLGTGVVIVDDAGAPQWWGLVNTVKIKVGGAWMGLSLDEMWNSVAVTYTTGGESQTLDYISDAASIAEYGFTKQRLETLQKVTDATEAAQRQQVMLALLSRPNKVFELGAEGADYQCEIECIGYYRTLAWKNYTRAAISWTNWTEPSPWVYMEYAMRLGTWFTHPILDAVAQIITTGSEPFNVAAVEMYVGGVGPPSPGLSVKIFSYVNQYNPEAGTLLAQTDYFKVGTAYWSRQLLTSRPLLTANTNYWVELLANGVNIGDNKMWVLSVNPSPVGANLRGRDFDTGHWLDPPALNQVATTLSIPIRLYGVLDNTVQVGNVVTAVNQFITAVDVRDAAGITTDPQRDGTMTALDIVEELLSIGTTNFRRLLATVTHDRVLRIYEEPVESRDAATLRLTIDGRLVDRAGNPITAAPVGQWCVAEGVSLPSGRIPDPGLFFIESADWQQNDQWSFTPRGMIEPWKFAQVENG